MKLLTTKQVRDKTTFSSTTMESRIYEKTHIPPIRISDARVAFIEEEIDEMICAMVQGEDMKKAVETIVSLRESRYATHH